MDERIEWGGGFGNIAVLNLLGKMIKNFKKKFQFLNRLRRNMF